MPIFNDAENKQPNVIVPDGDYIFKVIGFATAISKGAKTAGSDVFDLTLEIENAPGTTVWESLIDHESTGWKLDCFIKSAGVQLDKGEGYSFMKSEAAQKKWRWINPFGLRGWCRITSEEYTGARDGKKHTKNRVAIFYTDKPKLSQVEIEEENIPFA